MFEQNDFIATEKVTQLKEETIIYSVFQTGIDNYRVEFKTIVNQDTSKLFNYYINDAVYSKANSFKFRTQNDTLVILNPYQAGNIFYKSPKGNTIEVANSSETKPK